MGADKVKDAEFPRIRKTKVDKFMDEFDETHRELRTQFVNYDTTIAIDYKNLKQEINQNDRSNQKQFQKA